GEVVALEYEGGRDGKVYRSVQLGRELRVSDMARNGPAASMTAHCSGYVLDSLTLGIAALLDTRSLEDVLVDVVRIGWDTDTNAAIAGGLLGARDGEEAVPARWREKLQFGKEFREIAVLLTREE
ncbi:ADP-ribosylglycohydrolase family protein, partial [Candidatus Bathyarchaeota archaeon]|nr:ADP-ribosylglycohydrolase family protein [Candidatus Bathyarchaeota archaeon]